LPSWEQGINQTGPRTDTYHGLNLPHCARTFRDGGQVLSRVLLALYWELWGLLQFWRAARCGLWHRWKDHSDRQTGPAAGNKPRNGGDGPQGAWRQPEEVVTMFEEGFSSPQSKKPNTVDVRLVLTVQAHF